MMRSAGTPDGNGEVSAGSVPDDDERRTLPCTHSAASVTVTRSLSLMAERIGRSWRIHDVSSPYRDSQTWARAAQFRSIRRHPTLPWSVNSTPATFWAGKMSLVSSSRMAARWSGRPSRAHSRHRGDDQAPWTRKLSGIVVS